MFRIISLGLIFFLFCILNLSAQNIKVESFERLDNDITARVNVVKDANDEECALIKMMTTDASYDVDERLKRDDSRVGEIWFYVPQGTKRIVIRHQKLGKMVYSLPETLKPKTTYQIKLPDNVEIIVHEDVGGQYLVMNVQPTDASVYIDNILETMNDGSISKMLRYGEHIFRVEHPLYETKNGTFTITNKKEQIDIKLIPAYGYLSFISTPLGGEVTVNGKVLGYTPFKSEALREGTYRIKTFLSSYIEDERDVIVTRGQTKDVSIPLVATFGYLEVITTPEQGADVYVNNMKVGTTPYRSDKLSAGVCRVKVVRSMYAPQEREVKIVKGETERVSFNLTETFGEMIICSEDPQAEIVINGEKKGFGSWKGRLLEGFYQLSSYKKNHRNGTKSVEVKSGIDQQIVIPAPIPIYGSININSTIVGAIIKIDGKEVGRTPDVIQNVLIGEREIEVSKEGCASFKRIVSIEEGKVMNLNVNLSKGKRIQFLNDTRKAILIDGKDYGVKGSLDIELSYGKHILSITEDAKKLKAEFEVTVDSPVVYSVIYRTYTLSDVPYINPNKNDFVMDGKNYICGECVGLFNKPRGFILKNKAYIGIVEPKAVIANRVSKIVTYDFSLNKWGELSSFPKDCKPAEYSFVQGYPLIRSYNSFYIWNANAWKKIIIPVSSDFKDGPSVNVHMLSYKGECFLFYTIENYGYYRIYWKDLSTNLNRKLGEGKFDQEFQPKYSTLTISNAGLLSYKCDRFENYYGRSWMYHKEERSIVLDFLPSKKDEILKGVILEPLSLKKTLDVKKAQTKESLNREEVLTFGSKNVLTNKKLINSTSTYFASDIDWEKFPEKNYPKAKEQVFLIGSAAYVPVIHSTSTNVRESFKQWDKSFGYMKNYIVTGYKMTLSVDAFYKYDFQEKVWSKFSNENIPSKTAKIYTSNPSPRSDPIPSFSINRSGQYLVVDSRYRYNTETNSWE